MEPIDRLLRDDLKGLIDRIASVHGKCGASAGLEGDPDLRARIDEAEARLSALRLRLLEDYEEWRLAMEACEGLWALWRLRNGEAPVPEEASGSEVLRAA